MKKFKLIKEYPGYSKEDIGKIAILQNNGFAKNCYQFNNKHYISPNIEEYPEFWEEIIKKDYEILSLIFIKDDNWLHDLKRGQIVKCRSHRNGHLEFETSKGWDAYSGVQGFQGILSEAFSIYSVKRLSDGEIFTIGDKITTKGEVINEFEIINNKLKIWFVCPSYSYPSKPKNNGSITGCGNMGFNWLNTVKKLKIPLFTTEDGVDIFNENIEIFKLWTDKYWCATFHWTFDSFITNNNTNYIPQQIFNKEQHGILYFSTKEKAEEYIIENKPCLSVNDVAKIFVSTNYTTNKGNIYPQGQKLRELVKQKLNLK